MTSASDMAFSSSNPFVGLLRAQVGQLTIGNVTLKRVQCLFRFQVLETYCVPSSPVFIRSQILITMFTVSLKLGTLFNIVS